LKTKIKQKYDLRKTFTPLTFLKVTQAFREMKVGEILQIKGDDPKTRREIFQDLNTFHFDSRNRRRWELLLYLFKKGKLKGRFGRQNKIIFIKRRMSCQI